MFLLGVVLFVFFSTRQIAYMQNKLITAGQLVVGVIRADVVRGVDSDAGQGSAHPRTCCTCRVRVASLAHRQPRHLIPDAAAVRQLQVKLY